MSRLLWDICRMTYVLLFIALLAHLCYNLIMYDKVNSKGNRYYEDTRDGKLYRIYENGTEYNMTDKHLVKGPEANRISTDTASEYHQMRIAKHTQAARNGMLEAARLLSEGIDTPELAWSAVNSAQTILALDPDAGHASTKAAEFLRKACAYDDKPASLTLQDGSKRVVIDGIPEGELMALLGRMNTAHKADATQYDTIEGTLTDDA